MDGDVKDGDIEKILLPTLKHNNNVIKLLWTKRPESVIYDYIMSINEEHNFWQVLENTSTGFSWQYCHDHGPESSEYEGKERERYKQWFKDHLLIFESYNVVDCWIHDNVDLYKQFLQKFYSSYNSLAERLMMQKTENENE